MRSSIFILVICFSLLSLAGCQSQSGYNTGKPATNWNPFAGWGQSRVPPPGTNQYDTSTLAPTQGYTVPAGTPFAPLPPGATPVGGAVAPGPGVYGAPQTSVAPSSTNPQASKPGSLGPAQSTPVRRASYEDPATQYPSNGVQPANGVSLSRSEPAPANQITPY